MLDFRTVPVEEKITLYITHVIYVFITFILLINFLIALFSNLASWVNDHKFHILAIQRLSMLTILEHRLSKKGLLDRYFRRYQSRYFVEKEGKLYPLMKDYHGDAAYTRD